MAGDDVKVDLEELERISRAATRARWHWGDHRTEQPNGRVESMFRLYADGKSVPIVCLEPQACWLTLGADTAHIAANSPPVTLALIERIRELEEALNDALAYTIPGDERDRLVQVLAKWPKVKEGK